MLGQIFVAVSNVCRYGANALSENSRGLSAVALLTLLVASSSLHAADKLVLAVSEGTSGGQDAVFVQAKFEGLAQAISKALGVPVQVLVAREFERLEQGMKDKRFDLVIARPSDYPARGIRDYGYSLVATAKPDGQCLFIARKGTAPFKSLKEISGKRISLPEETSYMARLCRAELREQGINVQTEQIKFHREQGAVAYAVENSFADIGGVASYSGVAKSWEKKGVIVWRSRAQPYQPLVAGPDVTPAQVQKMRKLLDEISADPNSPMLKRLEIKGFDTAKNDRLLDLLKWIEAK